MTTQRCSTCGSEAKRTTQRPEGMQRKVAMSRADASMRLHALMHGEKTRWWYAFAMGSGCTIENGNDEVMRAIRDEDALLRSILEPKGQAIT